MKSFKEFITEGQYSRKIPEFMDLFDDWLKRLHKSPKEFEKIIDSSYQEFIRKKGKNFYAWISFLIIKDVCFAAYGQAKEKEAVKVLNDFYGLADNSYQKEYKVEFPNNNICYTLVKEFITAYEKRHHIYLHSDWEKTK